MWNDRFDTLDCWTFSLDRPSPGIYGFTPWTHRPPTLQLVNTVAAGLTATVVPYLCSCSLSTSGATCALPPAQCLCSFGPAHHTTGTSYQGLDSYNTSHFRDLYTRTLSSKLYLRDHSNQSPRFSPKPIRSLFTYFYLPGTGIIFLVL